MLKKDKNNLDLEIDDEVTIGEEKFKISQFKLRSYGYVVYSPDTGNAYNLSDIEKVIPTEKPKVENINTIIKNGE